MSIAWLAEDILSNGKGMAKRAHVGSDSGVHSKGNVCAKCGVRISGLGSEAYYRSADGLLMPVRKEQPPPDLRYFPWAQK